MIKALQSRINQPTSGRRANNRYTVGPRGWPFGGHPAIARTAPN